jgi:putative membrane protein
VWVREAVNGLLPVARVGGEVAAARLMIQRGVRAPTAVASIVADMTISLGTQALFTVVGVVLLVGRDPTGVLARSGALLLLGAALLVLLLAVAQRLGAFGAAGRVARRMLGDRVEGLVRGGRRTDRALRAVYRGRLRVLGCAAWQLAGWAAGAAEIWTFLALIGARVPVSDAIALEAMVQAVSSAAFVVPGALGVQEGAFAVVGHAIGLPPGVALALAIFRRARDIIAFVPALVLWQGTEGRRLLARE